MGMLELSKAGGLVALNSSRNMLLVVGEVTRCPYDFCRKLQES